MAVKFSDLRIKSVSTIVPKDAYLSGWNATIFGNATAVLNVPPVKFVLDGSSGALDIARQVKERVKNLAYAYRASNNSVYAERIWTELLVSGVLWHSSTKFDQASETLLGIHYVFQSEFETHIRSLS
jgi:hypothetical protein